MNSNRGRFIGRSIVAVLVVYWAALLVGTHLPAGGRVLPGWDKALHAGAYAALTFLLLLAWNWGRPATLLRYLAVVAVVAGYAAIDEFLQLLVPGRHADLFDWAADLIGALFGLAVYAAIRCLIGGSLRSTSGA